MACAQGPRPRASTALPNVHGSSSPVGVSARLGAQPGVRRSHFLPLAWSAVRFCPGSEPSRAARAPSDWGPPRFILRLALSAASWPEPPSGEARGSAGRAGTSDTAVAAAPTHPQRGVWLSSPLPFLHPPTYLPRWPFITHPSICPPNPLPTKLSFIHLCKHTFIYLSTHAFIHPLIHSFIYTFIHSPTHAFICPSIHAPPSPGPLECQGKTCKL